MYSIDLFEKQLNEKYSSSTVKSYIHAVKQFEKWLMYLDADLLNYSRSDVQQYIDYLSSKKLSAATINKIFNSIKNFSVWSKKIGAIEDIRVVKQRSYLLEAPKSMERTERNSLIRLLERSGNKRNLAIVLTMLYTGIRVSECRTLDLSDLTMGERKGNLTVRSGKGNKEREIPLHSEVRRAILKYLETRFDSNPALFLSNRGERISIRSIQTIFSKYGINSHQCRHTFITSLLREGKDIALIQSLTGHSSVNMIGRYGRASENDKQRAIDTIFINS